MCGCSALTLDRRTADRLHAQAIELGALSAQIAHVVAQAVPAGQLPQPEGNEWAQRLMTRKLLSALMSGASASRIHVVEATSRVARRLCYDGTGLGSPVILTACGKLARPPLQVLWDRSGELWMSRSEEIQHPTKA